MNAAEVLAVKAAEYGVYQAVMDNVLATKRVDPAAWLVAYWNGRALAAALDNLALAA